MLHRSWRLDKLLKGDKEGALAATRKISSSFTTPSPEVEERFGMYQEHMGRFNNSTPDEMAALMRGEERQKAHLRRLAGGRA